MLAFAVLAAVGLALNAPVWAAERSGGVKDLFADGTWHAAAGSWPGTIRFDAKTHKVVLQPVGSATIEATYAYTVINSKATGAGPRKHKGPGLVEGVLTMTASNSQVSRADYTIEAGRNLTLTFRNGAAAQVERYTRMTADEEAAELKRIQQMVKDGRLPKVGP